MKPRIVPLLLTLTSFASTAQEVTDNEQSVDPKPRLIDSYLSAKPLERVAPHYPEAAAKRGEDGWAQVSYVIGTDGKVKNAVVLNSSGYKGFERAALNAVKNWQFEPAVANGETIEQCDNSVKIKFLLHQNSVVSRKFHLAMRRFNNAIESKDIKEAQTQLDKIDALKSLNMTETFWRNYIAISLYQLTADNDKKYTAVRDAYLSFNDASVNKTKRRAIKSYLLQNKLVYLANSSRYSSALSNYQELLELAPEDAAPYQPTIEKIHKIIAAQTPIFVPAKIRKSGVWSHKLARSAFSITDATGRLDKVEVRCDRKYNAYTFAEGVQWNIPESWGQCRVHLLGEPSAKFNLVELSAS